MRETDFPSGLAESYGYDAIGNLQSKTDRKGQMIQYVYDALNRLTQKQYPNSTNVDYVYDLAGKIQQVNDPTGTYSFAYDNMGRLIGTTTQYSFLPGVPYSTVNTYDAASNRTGFAAPDGTTNVYAFDNLNRLSTLTNSGTGQFTFGYDGLSRRTQLTRPNGINTNYSYDNLSRLLSVLHQAGGTTLDGASYVYDNAGNRTSKTNQLNAAVSNFSYDNLYQLTGVTGTNAESYTYDEVGNRLSSLGVPLYNYNSSNQLTSNSNASYTFDANGNTLTKADTNGTTSYTWDFENRLTQVTLPGSGGTVIFRYDPFGRRIQKSSPSGTANYLYDKQNVIEEMDGSGNVLARYTPSGAIDEPLAMLRSGSTSYYEQDGLDSVTSLSNPAGTLANTYIYDSFGKLTASAGTITNPFRYTGREFDQETGLLFNRARYFDPSAGRFLSEDPSDFDGGMNFYAYVGNDPVNWTDPFGLERMGYGDIANLVAKNNRSGQSNELIICMIYKESTFDPDASQPGSNSARGLMGVTDAAATQMGDDWEDLGDPAANIDTGSGYLAWRIHLNHGNVRNGLWGYGTGRAYADSLLKCENCLVKHATANDQCKTKDCLEPLHSSPKPKTHPRPKPRRPRKPKS